jgi:hypothetical protein
MTFAGLKKCMPSTSPGRPDAAQRGKHLLLDGKIFKDRLNHEIDIGKRLDPITAHYAIQHHCRRRSIQASLRNRALQSGAQTFHARSQRRTVGINEQNAVSGGRQTDCDTGAHRTRTEYPRPGNPARLRCLARTAFRKEQVSQCARGI